MANGRRYRHQRRRDFLLPPAGLAAAVAIAVVAIAVLLLIRP